MRYIEKGDTPQFMTDWLNARRNANQVLSYDEFSGKRALNDVLRKEQKHICCYCQQIITHFQGKKNGGSHNEHLVPQNGVHANPDLQMDYFNLYACCNYSVGSKKNKQHCGEAKHDDLIPNLLQRKSCHSLFKYNSIGEIIPNGVYLKYDQYLENEASLTQEQKEALQAIKVLNLNCSYLVTERKAVQTKLFKVLSIVAKERIERKVKEFEAQDKYHRFIDMLLYYMKRKVA